MRCAWPTFLDVWSAKKTVRHVERLADIVEIVMAALRGDEWFKQIWQTEPKDLPGLFNLHVSLCRLVQQLNARLSTEYLKYKRERLHKFKVAGRFSELWRDGEVSKGLLLFGFVRAVEHMA